MDNVKSCDQCVHFVVTEVSYAYDSPPEPKFSCAMDLWKDPIPDGGRAENCSSFEINLNETIENEQF